jgi:hypothetical protein
MSTQIVAEHGPVPPRIKSSRTPHAPGPCRQEGLHIYKMVVGDRA